jgi:hypothetical protein
MRRTTEKAQLFDETGQSSLVSSEEKTPFKFSDIAILVRAKCTFRSNCAGASKYGNTYINLVIKRLVF